jgi:outer membrane protein assembly factor BamB
MSFRHFAVMALAFVLGGCGSGAVHFMREGVPAGSVPRVEQQIDLKKSWRRDIGAGYTNNNFLLIPYVGAGKIYAAEPKGGVVALDTQTGKVLWRRDIGEALAAGVGVGGATVVVVTREGEVVGLGAADGLVLWRKKVGSEVLARPVVSGDKVLLRSGDGQVIGLSLSSGKIVWRVRQAVPALSVRGLSAPLILEDVAVVGFASGRLSGIDPETGRELWNVPISRPSGSNEIDRLVDIDTDPYRIGDLLFVAAYQSQITALSLQTKRIQWQAALSTVRSIGSSGQLLLVTTDDGSVTGITVGTGKVEWIQDKIRGRGVTAPLGLGNSAKAVVGDYEGYLYLIDAASGELLGHKKGRGGAVMGIFSVDEDGNFLTLSENGALTAWSVRG